MKASITSFILGLNHIKEYIQENELISKLLSFEIDETAPMGHELYLLQLKDYSLRTGISRRQFNYNSIIVTLYGYLEEYIESLLRAYVNYLNEIVPAYSGLPSDITEQQINLSFRLIGNIERSRYRNVITSNQLISNLYSCIANADKYKVNAEAFTHHRANFRADIVQECFVRVGIDGLSKRILENSIFSEYLQKIYPGQEIKKIDHREAFAYLDDLADRRNDVAHGTPPDNILAPEIILDYIIFLEAYGRALYEVVRTEALQYEVKHKGIELGYPILVLHGRKVIGISLKYKYIFNWDGIPGTENENLIDFLIQKFGIEWVREARIEKIDDDKKIIVSVESKSLSIELNEDKTGAILKINDGRTNKFIAKTENNKLNIYRDTTLHKGDLIVAKTPSKEYPYICGEIQELQIDKRSYPEVSPDNNIGILLPFKAKPNYLFILIPNGDN